jgi:predicted transposase YbfD/YdcC
MQTKCPVQLTASEQSVLDGVKLRLISADEQARFDELIVAQHYLKDATLVGERLCYVAEYGGRWLALLAWSAAAYHLKERDQWIGWTEEQRRRRLGWLTNNSRFLILEGAHYPNLASRVMKLCIQRLAADWQTVYAHPVLAAESFVDSQLFRGTCYKVSGWTLLGQTTGWGRHQQDFYVRHDRPKQLWVRELRAGARELLRTEQVPVEWQALEAHVTPRCPYGVPILLRMVDYFWQVPDWRKVFKRYPCAGLLALALCATLCGVVRGQRDLAAFGRGLTQAQRRALRFRRNRHTGKYPAPCETTFFRLLKYIDPHELEKALLACQAHVLGPLTEQDRLIAYDGKTLNSANGLELASAFSVQTGRWLGTEAVATGSNEIPAVQRLLARTDLSGKTGVLDALHTQVETARQIVQDCGGDYVLTVKGNQKGVGQTLQQLWEGAHSAFSPSADDLRSGTAHGVEQGPHGSAHGGAVYGQCRAGGVSLRPAGRETAAGGR